MTTSELPRILRKRGEPEYPTFLELFFDLVYIFMLSRLSQALVDDLSIRNVAQTAVLLLAAWWVWVLTAWLTDLFNPRLPIVQALVLLIMLGTLVMAVAVPRAFGAHGFVFVAAYFGIHLARDAVLIPSTRVHRAIQARSVRVFFWFLVTAGLWIGGVFTDGTTRLVLWTVAVAVDLGSARIGWPTPRLGRTELSSQIFTGTHLAERHREIFIIALGELILTAGSGLAADFDADRLAVSAVAFASTVLLFQLYFHRIRQLLAPGNLASVERVRPGTSTSYTHLVMVAGTVLISTGISLVIDDPWRSTPVAWILVLFGGPALFLLGTCLFDYVVAGRILWSRVVAIVALVAIGPAMPLLPPLGIMIVANAVLLLTLVADVTGPQRRPTG
ncbi:low temperature requirement protein A [Plantactinospora soyae]|uniref:Low temperature requirement protein LtrA n=1 Tax=Plantactinospora soyae TaxID=1544732 RepID=A0A927QWY7_9ACTN|nr:low temperature requirement protein A [Plantactinospora soyae]MBE1487455.1 low temperature requirement protein LtrA [Plantactinospora soyae]